MKNRITSDKLAPTPLGRKYCPCSHYPNYTQQDGNPSLYDLVVRFANGDQSKIGKWLRTDAQYDSKESCDNYAVSPSNDPEFNLMTAKYRIQKAMNDAHYKLLEDVAAKQAAESQPTDVSAESPTV
nr:hypothetical protein IUWQDXFC_IUWQDXFC_CDS_0004 [Microvirus sp.]